MSAHALRRITVPLVAAVIAAALSGCGGGVSTSPGPIEPSVNPTPSSAPVPPGTAHQGVTAVSAQERAAIAAAMRGYGMTVRDPAVLNMSYSADRQQVLVTGNGMRMRASGGMPGAAAPRMRTIQRVTLENAGGTWRVLNVVGEK